LETVVETVTVSAGAVVAVAGKPAHEQAEA
jgi:hypothetical protein